MTDLLVQPQAIAMAAEDVAEIGSAINRAHAAAAGPTSGVVAAAADEVSAATTRLFNTFGLEYQALLNQAATFHDEFVQALAAAANAYAEAEIANATRVSEVSGPSWTPLQAVMTPAQNVTLVMGGTGDPVPSPSYIASVFNKYVAPNFACFSLSNAQPLYTPESDYPLDGSISQGVNILNNAILQQISAGNNVVVVGYSQSAVISSLEMQALASSPNPPSPSQLSFVLLGDPMNPNGGLMERFPGLMLPSLGVDFYGATMTNTIYPTHIYTIEYDGFADFPRYPLDVLADLNALAGIPHAHEQYANLSAALVATAITLPTDPAYGTATTYSMIPTNDLPLLDGLRTVPVIGNPLADLLQPDLTYLVNWGYGNPAYGYSTGPANVPTPFGLVPPLSATIALGGDLVTGTQQGIGAFVRDIDAISLPSFPDIARVFTSPPAPPTWHLPTGLTTLSIDGFINGLETGNSRLVNALTRTISTAYTTLLPTADIANALLTSIPSYDVNLFLDGIAQAVNGDPLGLLNAIGDPIAADAALATIVGGVEALVLSDAAQSIAEDFASLL